MGLSDVILDPKNRPVVVAACCQLIDQEVASKSGLSGFAVKAGYAAVKNIKPGFIGYVVGHLLPDFVRALDPIWSEGVAAGKPAAHLTANRSRVAEALLAVTDAKSKKAESAVVRGTYDKLRGSAKKNVEEAVPRLATLLEQNVK